MPAVAHVEDQADRARNLAVTLDCERALGLDGPATRTRNALPSARSAGRSGRWRLDALGTRCWRPLKNSRLELVLMLAGRLETNAIWRVIAVS
jgi:hypothetical protein